MITVTITGLPPEYENAEYIGWLIREQWGIASSIADAALVSVTET